MKKIRKIPVVLMAIFIMLGCGTVYGDEIWEQDGAPDYENTYEGSVPESSPMLVMGAGAVREADYSEADYGEADYSEADYGEAQQTVYEENTWEDAAWTQPQDTEESVVWVEEYNAADSEVPADLTQDISAPAEEEQIQSPKPVVLAPAKQQLGYLPVEIKSDVAKELAAGSFSRVTLEIKNSIYWDMNNIELVLSSRDGRFIITSFTEDYEAWNTGFTDRMNEESKRYRERVLRISNIPAGAAIRADVLIYAEENITIADEGLEAQALCIFRSGDEVYEGGGIWRLKPEVTQEPEEAYQEQINVADEYIPAPETEDAQVQPQAEFEVYGQQEQEQEEYGADEQQALAQEDPEVNEQQHSFRVFGIQDETEDQETGTETEEPAPNYIEFSVPEVEEQMDMTINEEEQMITFNVIGDENEEGAELTEEDEEYYDYYDYGYYDDWYSYDSVSAEQINTATPYLLVKSYSHKKTIKTGEAFGIDVTFLNTSGKLGMENIVIKVETSDALSLENGTNVLFVNDLAAGQSCTQTLHMLAASECKNPSQSIAFTVSFEYVENKERKQGTASESITIPVSQQDRLELRDPVYDEMEAGKEGVISVSYVNKGYTSLYNMEAELSMENADAVQTVVYAGNVESGKSGTLDFLVTPLSDGDYKGEITLKYEDSSSKETAVVIPLEFTSTMAYVAEDFNWEEEMQYEETQEQNSFPQPLMMGASGGVLIAGIIVTAALVRKKRAKRRSEEEDEDWFDSAE